MDLVACDICGKLMELEETGYSKHEYEMLKDRLALLCEPCSYVYMLSNTPFTKTPAKTLENN